VSKLLTSMFVACFDMSKDLDETKEAHE